MDGNLNGGQVPLPCGEGILGLQSAESREGRLDKNAMNYWDGHWPHKAGTDGHREQSPGVQKITLTMEKRPNAWV